MRGFLLFSGGKEREKWLEWVKPVLVSVPILLSLKTSEKQELSCISRVCKMRPFAKKRVNLKFFPANIYLFKVAIETQQEVAKYVPS